jgi:predicted aspartyl protease
MHEFPYDSACDPAVPVCDVTLTAKPTGQQVKLKAIIDTGADGTIIPIQFLQKKCNARHAAGLLAG